VFRELETAMRQRYALKAAVLQEAFHRIEADAAFSQTLPRAANARLLTTARRHDLPQRGGLLFLAAAAGREPVPGPRRDRHARGDETLLTYYLRTYRHHGLAQKVAREGRSGEGERQSR